MKRTSLKKSASELFILNKELVFQKEENEKLLAELITAKKEISIQNNEKEKRAVELSIANKELAFQNDEKEKRAEELTIANKELAFQNEEKEKLAVEKEKRAVELGIANKELAFENKEKEKRAAELTIANIELAFQNDEKEKRAAELGIANIELAFQNEEKEKRAAELITANYARSLIEASLDPLVTISVDGKIKDVNEASIKVTGVEREKLIDTDFSNYFTEPHKAQEGYQQVFEKGFVADYPLTIKHKNGNLTDVLYNASVYKDDKGNVLGVFAAARDVTERKMFEKEMVDAKVSAENATKSKQQFLSNMSHEIRTPLNSILGFTNVLLKTELGAQQKVYVEAINTSGKSLNLLINDILDLAKVDAGKMTFEKHPIEIRKSISEILHSFDLKIKEKNLELVVEHDSKVPSKLLCDALRLNQVFFNLLSNAIKFTHKGKIKLTFKLLHEDKENVTIEFVVSDSGIGIADNKLNSIFNLFEQAEINTSTSYGGTGLGLSIVKQLIEAQGGSVSVKSKLGEGSAFSFILPFGKANLKLEEEIILLNPVSEIKNLRVLVAEDVALNQLLIKIILNDFGFEHEIVGNGKLAIEKMQTNTYDIILMDLQMPEMNGFEATEYIRKTLKSDIPIIALTADVTTADVSKCKEFGMDSYISKPIDEKLLYNKIVELVRSYTDITLQF